MTSLKVIEEARKTNNIQLLSQAIPLGQYLGLIFSVENDRVLCELPFEERHIGNPVIPALHGGIIGSLLEYTAIAQVIWDQHIPEVPDTVSTTIDYLRPALTKATYASSTIVKQGKSFAVVQSTCWQDTQKSPVAILRGTFRLGG